MANCSNCGAQLQENMAYCPTCGASTAGTAPVVATVPTIPEAYRPLSPWAFFGYGLLFSIPVVGFICLIVFSCKSNNLCRRNFARSYWIPKLLTVALWVFIMVSGFSLSSILG